MAVAFTAAPASAYDPRVDWRTLTSPHFRVHYAEGTYGDALDFARAAEAAYAEVSERLGWTPSGRTDIVVIDERDYAQGFAVPLPYRHVGVHAVAPDDESSLGDYDDWPYILIAHELTHTIHMDTIRGLPAAVNTVFGTLLVPNSAQPGWFVEGLAVYMESALTSGGRAHSPFSEMMLRTAFIEEAFPDLGEFTGDSWYWPQSSVRYIYGGHFLDYIATRFGEKALREISHEYGSRLVPWAMNLTVERVTGVDYPTLYGDFVSANKTRYMRQRSRIEALGRIEGERLTHRGQRIGPPRVGPDGTIYFVEAPIGSHAVLRALAPDGSERVVCEVYGDALLAVATDGREALIAQREIFDTYLSRYEIFRVDLQSGAREQLTDGARARGVDLSPDGRRITFVQLDGGHSVLRVASYPELADVRTLVDLGPGTNIWTPRFSPDGGSIAFVGFVGRQRDLFVVTSVGAEPLPRRLTSDRAQEGGPSFTPDGRLLLFHSDRDGVFNIYAAPLDLGDGGAPLRRVTRVLTGAFHPDVTPSGDAVVYRVYGSKGFDLARLAVADWDALPLAEEQTDDDRMAQRLQPAPRAQSRASIDVYPSEDYSPLRTLIPKGWLPVTGVDAKGTTIGVAVSGFDVLGQHSYALEVLYGIESEFLHFGASYTNAQFHPAVTARLSRRLAFAPIAFVRNRRPELTLEEVWVGRISTRLPLWQTRDASISVGASYEMVHRRNVEPFRFDPEDFGVIFPDEGRFAALRVDLTFSNARGYIGSISAEEGGRFSIAGRFEDPYLGSEYSAVSGSLDYVHYIENPFVDRHVLMLRVAAGYGRSNYRRRSLFSIRGMPQRDLVLDLIKLRLGQGGALRGLSLVPQRGDALITGTAEYRLPIFDIQSGYDLLPVFLGTLHGAVFLDAAAIADTPDLLHEGQHYTMGGELRLSMTLGYVVPVTIRFGWGFGLGSDANTNNWYIVLDQSF